MIDQVLIIKLAQKYDSLDVNERNPKIINNPDYRAQVMLQMNDRKRLQRTRDILDPTRPAAQKAREFMDKDNAARKDLRASGTIDGIAYKLGVQLADINRQVKNKLKNNPKVTEAANKILSDIGELYHLRNKLIEFAETLRVVGPGKIVPVPMQGLLDMQTLTQSYLTKVPHFKGVTNTLHEILAKLKEMATNMLT